jgi:hypothetical protein
VGGVGRGQILKLAGIAPAAAGGCWGGRGNKPGCLNRSWSRDTTRPWLTWVGEVGGWPEHDDEEREVDGWGASRVVLDELDAAHTDAEERGASCDTWERAPREGCQPRGGREGGSTAAGMRDEMRDEMRWRAARCLGWHRGGSPSSPACSPQPAAALDTIEAPQHRLVDGEMGL